MSIVRSPVRSVVRSPVQGVFGGASLLEQATSALGNVAPYHYLDFIANRALYAGIDVGAVTGATGYSFTRASAATYTNADGTIEHFESGQPRMKRTADSGHNLLVRSQEFDDAAWTKTNATVTADATAAPDGTLTADKIITNNGATNGRPQQTVTTVNGTAYTVSCYAKASEWGFVRFRIAEDLAQSVWFNLNTGAVGTRETGWTSASIQSVGNGWYRCSATHTTVGTSVTYRFIAESADNNSATGDGTSGVFLWGAQLNEGSSATAYVATTTTPVYAARRGDRGVLIEGARTNLMVRSQEFGTTWTVQRTTVTENTIAAPDGTTTADTVLETVENGNHGLFQGITKAASSITYALSCHIKPNGRNWAILQLNGPGETNRIRVWFDLTGSGTVGSNVVEGAGFSFVSASIQGLANGWYRCVAVLTTDTSTALTAFVRTATADTTVGYVGDITKGLYLWGAQLEAASFPSSYIPTVAASATRAADVLTYTAGVSYPLQLWSEFERAVDTGGGETLLTVDAGSGANDFSLYVATNDRGGAFALAASIVQFDQNTVPTLAVGSTNKLAARLATNDARACSNGTLSTADATVTLPTDPTRLRLPTSFQYIRRIAVIQGAGTDANLVLVTT